MGPNVVYERHPGASSALCALWLTLKNEIHGLRERRSNHND